MENNRIEYKRELTDGLEKEVIAFLNYHDGGLIYIGVDAVGGVYGVSDCDAVQLAIKDRLKNNIQPSCLGLFDVIHETSEGKNIIKLIIASGSEKPYYLRKYGMSEKGCYIRIGSASEPMPVRMIEKLFACRTRNSIARIRSPRQNLGFEQLKIYYQEAGLTLGDKFAANLELLTEDGLYNYAAYLLADENGNSVQVAKYAGSDRVDLLESKEYGFCCLVKTCKQIIDRLEGLENRIINKITPRERISRPFWNPVALREALINAIIHNDYSAELVPKFELFVDRLEITSAGIIHIGKEQDDFFAGYSMPRNKTLMRVFKDLEMVEYLGSGMPRILKVYPREAYIFSSRFIRTTFPISQEALALEHEITQESTGKNYRKGVQERATGKNLQASGTVISILNICRDNSHITIPEIALELGLTTDSINSNLLKLRKQNKITRIGGRKFGHWQVLDGTQEFAEENFRTERQEKSADEKRLESGVQTVFRYAKPVAEVTPQVTPQVTGQVTGQVVRLLSVMNDEMSRAALQETLGLKHRDNFVETYLQPALEAELIEMTLPDKPNSRLQKYRLTDKGKALLVAGQIQL
jgi:ATP-dependent DNA helicase RecG